jgi:hypothetical protein
MNIKFSFVWDNCDEISNTLLKCNHYNSRKGRVVPVHATKTYEGVEVRLRLLLITALDGSK